MGKKLKIFIFALAVLLALMFLRDFIIKSVIGTAVTSLTGSPTRVGGLSLSLIKQKIRITNFKMYSPRGFPRDVLVDIPNIYVAYDLDAILNGRLHIRQIDFDLKEVGMVRDSRGKLNVDSLKIIEESRKNGAGKGAKKPEKEMPMRIELANLDIGRIVATDYRGSGSPVVKVYELNIKKSYKNITSLRQLALLVIFEPLKTAGIHGLKLFGVSMLAGPAALPVAAAFTFGGRDYAQESFTVNPQKAYESGLRALKKLGRVKKENETSGAINAVVNGAEVHFRLQRLSETATQVTVSARKLAFPQPETAAGVMYEIAADLKKSAR